MSSQSIAVTLKKIGLKPQQAAGQNFLLTESVVKRMVEAAGVTKKDVVLEIGPGLGVLTDALLATGATVIAVELDTRLFSYLKKKYGGHKNLQLVHADIFKVNLNEYVQDGQYKLVANLPYSGTSLFFRNFLSLSPRPTSMTVMIQREVAKRITARPGEMSVVAIMTQYYSQVEYLVDVPRENFWPEPNVDSAVVQCLIQPWPDTPATKKLFQVVKAGFSSRRKQLHNALSAGLHRSMADTEKLLAESGVPGSQRAQDLTLENWLTIAKNLSEK